MSVPECCEVTKQSVTIVRTKDFHTEYTLASWRHGNSMQPFGNKRTSKCQEARSLGALVRLKITTRLDQTWLLNNKLQSAGFP